MAWRRSAGLLDAPPVVVQPVVSTDAQPKADIVPIKKKTSAADQAKLREAEQAISKLTKEKERLETLMADPDFYKDAAKATDAQKQYAKIVKDLEDREEDWLSAQVS